LIAQEEGNCGEWAMDFQSATIGFFQKKNAQSTDLFVGFRHFSSG